MNTPTTTRASLIATASYNNRWLASLVAGSAVLGSSALALDNFWAGADTDWNTSTNWSLGNVPAFPNATPSPNDFDDAIINTNTAPIATVSANVSAEPRDVVVGRGTAGRMDHTAGSLHARSWMMVGHNGGPGVYNLADTSVPVATGLNGPFTGFGQGTGSMQVDGQFRIGRGAGANGTVNVNTTGTLNINSELRLGVEGGGAVGTLNLDSGTINHNNWLVIGNGGGETGTINISGGTLNKNGNDHLIFGDNGGTGTINMSAGAVNINGECWIGQNTGTGTLNISGGTFTSNNWVALGRSNNGSHGTVTHSGGTWNKTGGGNFIIGDNGQGIYNLSGAGALNINGEFWVSSGGGSHGDLNMTGGTVTSSGVMMIGRDGGVGTATVSGSSSISSNQMFVGQGGSGNGTLTLSSGTINTNSWTVIGRDNGTGTVNMTGGTWNKTGDGTFIVGSSGPGTMDMSGGLVDVQGGFTWVGENGGATTATLNLSGSAEWRTTTMSVGQNTPNAILNMNGGTVKTQRFIGAREQDDSGNQGGTGTINFNGTQIIATANNTLNFISNTVDNAVIGGGGLLVDSNGFNLAAPKVLSGAGGVVKSGTGTLTLSGASSYGGSNSVTAGKLALNGDSTGTGNITVADGAGLGVSQVNAANSLDPVNVTLGTSAATTLDIDLGNIAGNPTAAPLNVTGTLSLGGTVTVNVADQLPALGSIPLVSYVGPKGGSGSFTLGTLPNGVIATLNDDGTGLVSLNVTSVALPKWDGTDAPKYAKTAATTTGLFDVTVTDPASIVAGQKVFGPGIPTGATVTLVTGSVITLDLAATADAAAASLVFTTGTGSNDGVWDVNTTQNWIEQISVANSVYDDPNPVLFNDSATGPTAVVLNVTATPSSVVFNNSTLPYTLSGTGKITGSTGLTKSGTEDLTVSTDNDYTGVTTLAGGTTTVATLTPAGAASPLGAASAAAENLVLAGGTLDYTGGVVSIDRGLSVAAASSATVSTLNLAAGVTTSGQVSASLGKLHKTGPGTLTLTGTGANVLSNGDGDGTVRAFSVVEGGVVLNGVGQTNTITGRIGVGTAASASASLTLDNDASLTVNGWTNFSPEADTNTTLTIGGTSVYQAGDVVQFGLGANSVTNVLVEGSGSFNKGGAGWFSIGNSSNAVATMRIRNSGSMSTLGGDLNIGDVDSANGTLILEDAATVSSAGNVFIGKNSASGTMTMSGTTTMTCPETDVGGGNPSVGILTMGTLLGADTPVYTQGGRFIVGRDGGSIGTVTLQGDSSMTVGSYTSIGFNGGGSMIVKDSGSFSNTDDFSINENGDVPATVTVQDNGTLSMGTAATGHVLYVGRNDNRTGTLNIQGAATVSAGGTGGVRLASGTGSTGTVNLDGGTLLTKRVTAGSGNSTFSFNGGVLKAATGATLDFMSGLGSAIVNPGGAIIDSNGETIAISQPLGDGNGSLTKQGAGTLLLNGGNAYVGTTTVATGTLGGTGSVGGELVVPLGSTIAPGAGGVGTFSADDSLGAGSTIGGTYVCEISGANSDSLTIGDALDITGATLDCDELSAPASLAFVIASYGSLSGPFATVSGLPTGYSLDYSYLGGNQIAITRPPTVYEAWAIGFGLDPFTDGAPGADADGDGQINSVEFALGGSPVSGSDNAKVYHLVADGSVDGDAIDELLITIAVRSGTPVFAPPSGNPAATQDGFTCTIQGGTDLTFGGTASVVDAVAPPVPNNIAPTGYEWRTFSLDGSNGLLPTTGFLRVNVTP